MEVLLDTCALIWCVNQPEKLSEQTRDILTKPDAVVYVSPISCAEIACLAERGRITLDCHWRTWFDRYVTINGWPVVDITLEIIQEAYSLPGEFHQDPADRIIVATARQHNLHIVTGDAKILAYPHVRAIS